jgi:FSR family fosmidomycin resistance protein-like MFS transporter
LSGLLVLSTAGSYALLLAGAALLGTGSSIFHPESSRIARAASAGRHGLGQSVFQVGGNFGSALGPLLAAFLVLPHGRGSLSWFAGAALCGAVILTFVARWYSQHRLGRAARRAARASGLPARQVGWALALLVLLMISKYFYLASINSYYIFYLMHHFHLPMRTAQIYLFVFLAAAAAGVVIGGPIGDRFGRKYVIWGSILGVLPFTLALPHVDLAWTVALSVVIGLVLSSAFSAIVVYATELMPARVGLMSGLFFGLAFGFGGIGAAALGALADWTSIDTVYQVCAFLPAMGLLAMLLPNMERQRG